MKKCDKCTKTIFDSSSRYRERLKRIRIRLNDDKICWCDDCIRKEDKAQARLLQDNITDVILDKAFGNSLDGNFKEHIKDNMKMFR